jgi:transcriptional regulator with XRE-family HTH domain
MPRKAAPAHIKAAKALEAGKKPPTALGLEVAARLRAIQAELGKTDKTMAEALKIERSRWSNWVLGAMPAEEAMIELCDVAHVTLEWIYRGKPDNMLLAHAIRLTARVRGLDPDRAGPEVLIDEDAKVPA